MTFTNDIRHARNNHEKLTPENININLPMTKEQLKDVWKKFVRYEEGAQLYSIGIQLFKDLARDAGAIYRVKRCVLVNTAKVDEYLETFCEPSE